MSVLPSRAFAVNTSGGLKPAAVSAEMSARSISPTSDPSLVATQLGHVGQIDA